MAATSQFEKLLQDAFGVVASVDVIAQRHDGVVGLGIDGVDQGRKGDGATVNVAKGEGAMHAIILW